MNEREEDLLHAAERVADGDAAGAPPGPGGEDPVTDPRLRRLSQLARLASVHRASGRGVDAAGSEPMRTPGDVLFRWGPLDVLEKLGEGSFGDVYRAWDPSLQREVALKLRRAEPGSPAGTRRLIEEARRLARVRHPNVLTVHGAAEHDGQVGLWTDLVGGHTLEDWLAAHGPMGPHEAIHAGLDLARALAAVHDAGLLHGDIKTANIMRESAPPGSGAAGAGRIVLMDFGAARGPGGGGLVIGTPATMAPEVLRGDGASVASDLYSLGVVLYRLLAGRYPVEADSVEALAERHARGERSPLRDRRPDLSAAVVQVVEQASAPDPAKRFRSAGQMEAALLAALAGAHVPARRRRAARRALGGAAALLALAGVLWVTRARQAEQGSPGAEPSRPSIGAEASGGRSLPAAGDETAAGPSTANGSGPAATLPSAAFDVTLYRGHRGTRERLAEGGRVSPGDHLFMEVRGAEPLHVYVLNDDDAGSVFVLFPVPGVDLANPLPSGALHRLPGRLDGKPFDWVVSSAGGRERFLVAASRQPIAVLEQAIALIAPARAGRPVEYARLDGDPPGRLRGVGAMAAAEAAPPSGGGRLDLLARNLDRQARERGGVWLRRIELDSAPR